MRDAIASPPPAAPPSAPLRAAPRSFGRSLVAPFVVGVLVADLWAQLRLWLAFTLDPQRTVSLLRTLGPVLLLVVVILVFLALPAVVMLVSLMGDRRLMDAGRGGHVATWTGLAIALIALFLSWGLPYVLTYHGPLNMLAQDIALGLGDPQIPFPPPLDSGLMIGLAAAYALSRWATGSLARQVWRWLVVGALAGFGGGILVAIQPLVSWLTYIALLHPVSAPGCSGLGCMADLRTELSVLALAEQIGAALVGSIIGGALRIMPAMMGRRSGSAPTVSGASGAAQVAGSTPEAPPAATARTRTGSLRWLAAAQGLGILYGLCWVGALALAFAPALRLDVPEPLVAVGTGVLLLALPLVAIAVPAARGGMGLRGFTGLAIIAICLGALPAFILSLLPAQNIRAVVLLFALSNVMPILSLGVALGWVYSAAGRGTSRWWRGGTRAALVGGLGFGLVLVALTVVTLVQYSQEPACVGRGCFIGIAYYSLTLDAVAVGVIASPILALAAGPLGAWLRVRASGAANPGS